MGLWSGIASTWSLRSSWLIALTLQATAMSRKLIRHTSLMQPVEVNEMGITSRSYLIEQPESNNKIEQQSQNSTENSRLWWIAQPRTWIGLPRLRPILRPWLIIRPLIPRINLDIRTLHERWRIISFLIQEILTSAYVKNMKWLIRLSQVANGTVSRVATKELDELWRMTWSIKKLIPKFELWGDMRREDIADMIHMKVHPPWWMRRFFTVSGTPYVHLHPPHIYSANMGSCSISELHIRLGTRYGLSRMW